MSTDLTLSLFRPVSNLCFASKITEKGSILQLKDHLIKFSLDANHQSAYKEHFSCETALTLLMNNLLWNMEKGRVSVIVSLDLSSAFDTVDHGVLCAVLENKFGLTSDALQWITSYLCDRKMCTKVGLAKSSERTFNFSVPQGSCLGPVLFNMYSSTIADVISSEQDLGGYADDHILRDSFCPTVEDSEHDCYDRLQQTLVRVKQWMDSHSLKMNPDKTEFVQFGSRAMLNKTSITNINVAGDVVSATDELKYLGVYLDGNLTLDKFVNVKIRNSAMGIRSIKSIRKFIDINTAKLLAASLVLSHLDFANAIMCGLPAVHLIDCNTYRIGQPKWSLAPSMRPPKQH